MTSFVADEFHIHIDAKRISQDFECCLLEQFGYQTKDFAQGFKKSPSYVPERHLTKKFFDPLAFRKEGRCLMHRLKETQGMTGYVELECVGPEKRIVTKPFNSTINLPFKLSLVHLPDGAFRESEIHITLDHNNSDPTILALLESMGMYSAFMRKPWGMAQILTVQGSKEKISLIHKVLEKYLSEAGGVVGCCIKEERILDFWMSAPDIPRPPVVDEIMWGCDAEKLLPTSLLADDFTQASLPAS